MRLGLFPKPKSDRIATDGVPVQKSPHLYLIGFLVIMLFALVLHFIPQKKQTDQSIVEPYVEAVPSQSL